MVRKERKVERFVKIKNMEKQGKNKKEGKCVPG
jgi:hypothetical protein